MVRNALDSAHVANRSERPHLLQSPPVQTLHLWRRAGPRNEDCVEYESANGKGGVKSVSGANTGSAETGGGVWDWRGKSGLFFVTSHWEILGWGEHPAQGRRSREVGGDVVRPKTIFSAEGWISTRTGRGAAARRRSMAYWPER